jgi:hypothetical protein
MAKKKGAGEMTDGERQLIVSRLVDKGLLPYDGGVLDPAALENLTEREREVFGEFFFEEVENIRADLEAFLKAARPSVSKFEGLKFWLSARWLSMRLFVVKKRARRAAK